MTFHLFMLTITIRRHKETATEVEDRMRVKELTDRLNDRKFSTYHVY